MKTLYYKFRAFIVICLLRFIPRNAPVVFKGPGSALTLTEQIAVLGIGKILIVTDNFLNNAGILDGIKSKLDQDGVDYSVYDGVLPDPNFEQVRNGEAQLREDACEAVLAVGGGSVLDAGKMIALLHTNPGELKDFDGIQKARNLPVTLFAVPTTAGTGSEITLASVITDAKTHRKVPVADSKIIPSYVALDAQLMIGMPPAITAATGMDALTHAVESYLSKAATPSTEAQAKAAITLIFGNLARSWHDGTDLAARDAMALAAFYAGAAFSKTSVGYVHGIAHQLGRLCQTPHGNANAMVLPEVLSAYGNCIHPRLAELAILTGLGEPTESSDTLAREFIKAVTDLRAELELPLKPEGLQQSYIEDIVIEAEKEAGDLYPVPRYLSRSELTMVVRGLLPTT